MVKINISLEGENIEEIITELFNVGIHICKSNRKEIRALLKILADESLEVLLEHKTLEKGATLYRKINSEINWTYKQNKNKDR
jgi:hypothetical protein